jgi:hypothetical protein
MTDETPLSEIDPAPDGRERRRHARVELRLKARYLGADGAEHPCLVVNISAGGALLRAVTTPDAGDTVVVYIDQIGRFEAKVVRAGQHSFAVDYRGRRTKSERTADALTCFLNDIPPSVDLRENPRIHQDAPATVTLANGEAVPCSIIDISLTGASLEIDPRPALGSLLTLGKMAAKVVRRHEKGVGVVFSGPAERMDDAIAAATGRGDALHQHGPQVAGFGRKGLGA